MALTRIRGTQIKAGSIGTSLLEPGVNTPLISNVQIANSTYDIVEDLAVSLTGGYIIINGKNFGPNVNVFVGNTITTIQATNVNVVSSSKVEAEVGALGAGKKIIYLENTDNGATALRINGLFYSPYPDWITGEALKKGYLDIPFTLQIQASSDSPIQNYALSEGSSLPSGVSLSSNGLLYGTVTGIVEDTVYNFTILSRDQENQSNTKSFSLTISTIAPSNHGWFGGGYSFPGGFRSVVDRVDFSSDTSTASSRGSLNFSRNDLASSSNLNYGWFGAGSTPGGAFAGVSRIDWASDTVTATSKGPLAVATTLAAGAGSQNFGWWAGGQPYNNPVGLTTVSRIDYSSDTSTASSRGPLNSFKYAHGASSNENYAWFNAGAAGDGFTFNTRVDRIDFSSDTTTASRRGDSIAGRRGSAGTGNDDFGWFSPTGDRITYSNDTGFTTTRTPGLHSDTTSAAGNFEYGWWAGGGGPISRVSRMDFNADTIAASVRGPLTFARYGLAGGDGRI